MANNRNNTRTDLESSGARIKWAKIDKMYDSAGRLPNDSDNERENVRLYVAQMIADYLKYGNTNSHGRTFIDDTLFRTGDGNGGSSWTYYNRNSDGWVDSYAALRDHITNIEVQNIFDYSGNSQPYYTRNIMCMDSDGQAYSININTLFKMHLSKFLDKDFWEKRKITDNVREVFVTDSDVDLEVTEFRARNVEMSGLQINENLRGQIYATDSDLILTSNSNTIRADGNFIVDADFTCNGTTYISAVGTSSGSINGDLTVTGSSSLGDTNADLLTVAATSTFNSSVTINSTLGATGVVGFGDDLYVDGDVTLGTVDTNAHTVNGSIDLSKDLIVRGDLTVLGDTTTVDTTNLDIADNIITLNNGETGNGITLGSSGIQVERGTFPASQWVFVEAQTPTGAWYSSDNVKTGGSLYVDGNTTLGDTATDIVTIAGVTTIGSTLSVTGNVTFSSGMGITGNATVGGTLGVTGATTLSNTLGVTGNTTVGGTLGVTGATTLSSTLGVSSNATVGGTLGVTGATTLSNTLGVTGATTLSSTLGVSSNATVGGTLGVTGATTLSNTLGVTGATTLSSTLGVSSNTTVGGTLAVTGATTLSSTLGVSGTSTLAAVSATNITASGTLGVTGASTLTGAVTTGSTLTTGGNVSVSGSVTASGDVTAYSDRRLKSDIEVIDDALGRINNVSGYTFTMNGERKTGVIAQEIEAILPEAVHEQEDGMLSVAYGNLVGLLIQGMKEQQQQIEELKTKVEELTNGR